MNKSDPLSIMAITFVLFIVICEIIAVRSFSRLLFFIHSNKLVALYQNFAPNVK
jgi:hypothetical protein